MKDDSAFVNEQTIFLRFVKDELELLTVKLKQVRRVLTNFHINLGVPFIPSMRCRS